MNSPKPKDSVTIGSCERIITFFSPAREMQVPNHMSSTSWPSHASRLPMARSASRFNTMSSPA